MCQNSSGSQRRACHPLGKCFLAVGGARGGFLRSGLGARPKLETLTAARAVGHTGQRRTPPLDPGPVAASQRNGHAAGLTSRPRLGKARAAPAPPSPRGAGPGRRRKATSPGTGATLWCARGAPHMTHAQPIPARRRAIETAAAAARTARRRLASPGPAPLGVPSSVLPPSSWRGG